MVFGKVINTLLDGVDLPNVDDGKIDFSKRVYTYRASSMRMDNGVYTDDKNSHTSRSTAGGPVTDLIGSWVVADYRAAYADAIMGTLYERQQTWGPLFNYPRTFFLNWRATFESGKPDIVSNQTDKINISVSDIDQIIWMNLDAAKNNVSVGVIRFRRENRLTEKAVYTVGGFSATTNKSNVSFVNQASLILESLDLHKVTRISKSAPVTAKKSDNRLSLNAIAVILERVTRDRTTSLEKMLDDGDENMENLMLKAIYSGQVPYAEIDLKMKQPHVMPARATGRGIADVYNGLMLSNDPASMAARLAAATAKRLRDGLSALTTVVTSNPYDAAYGDSTLDKSGVDTNSDEDENNIASGELTPFSDSDEEDAL